MGRGRRGHVKAHSNEYNYTGLYPYPLPASVQNAQNTLSLFTIVVLHFRCLRLNTTKITCTYDAGKNPVWLLLVPLKQIIVLVYVTSTISMEVAG